MRLELIAKAKLPTPWGDFIIVGFEESDTKKDHIALIFGNIPDNGAVLCRIHSECLTGDALFSLRCDCGFQLEAALARIAEEGSGVLLYHRQEGRNIGLLNKIRAYSLQDSGMDTVEANIHLGFAAEERDFSICAEMLKLLFLENVRLLTNNPEKINALSLGGINVIERIPLIIGRNPKNEDYLLRKEKKMGHLF
ncbi:GTP cyclohydrolase II [Yersinia proxima]|uniref:GTP cyclohydrolase-2 n=1 Tax=Yersinia proxima TaxID=2890316 RepID=A0ABW9EUK1_9GAMM